MNIHTLSSKEIAAQNKSAWDSLWIASMNLDVNLVRCQKYLFPKGRGKKLLYIGFGEGQNLVYLAKQGFKLYGTEIAKSRIEETKKRLQKEKQRAVLHLVDSNQLPFDDNYFDIVVGWQSLCYNNRETLGEALREIKRVLRPSGQFLSSMMSPKQKLLCYKEIAPSVYHPSKKTGQQNCIVFCFKNKKQIRSMYREFQNIQIGYYSSDLFRGENFHYVIRCLKPKHQKK